MIESIAVQLVKAPAKWECQRVFETIMMNVKVRAATKPCDTK
jgi:hypothetical protein